MVLTEDDQSVIRETVARWGLEVDEIEQSSGPRPDTVSVRITVDGDKPVSLDELAAISEALDTPAQQWGPPHIAIQLEVTSRGVDTPLTATKHWRRNRARKVELTVTDMAALGEELRPNNPAKQKVTLQARIGDVDDAGQRIWLVIRAGRSLVTQWMPLDAIERAVVQIEFSAAPERELAALVADS